MTDPDLRQRLLRAQAALQRHQLRADVHQAMAPLVQGLALAREGGRWLRAHPAATALAVGALLAWHPRALLRVGTGLVGLWRMLGLDSRGRNGPSAITDPGKTRR